MKRRSGKIEKKLKRKQKQQKIIDKEVIVIREKILIRVQNKLLHPKEIKYLVVLIMQLQQGPIINIKKKKQKSIKFQTEKAIELVRDQELEVEKEIEIEEI